jgi:glycosyltransferase involved in cell wall biosynthesis
MANFGIITISYRREKVLQLFLSSIQRLRTELDSYIPVVVVGDVEHEDLCRRYFVEHIAMKNHPASQKFNRGVEYMRSIGVDYICIMGSDDIMSTDLAKNLISAMEKGIDLIGINTIFFYSADGKHRGKLLRLHSEGQIYGVARCIKMSVVEKAFPLWKKDSSWGMDGDCLKSILPFVETKAVVDGVCVDVKTEQSLNKITMWLQKIPALSDPKIFYNTLSPEEKQLLNEIE